MCIRSLPQATPMRTGHGAGKEPAQPILISSTNLTTIRSSSWPLEAHSLRIYWPSKRETRNAENHRYFLTGHV
jgi:hypothetical protein